ncbi:Cloroperoxidase [Rhizopus microsporus var. microsporus]|uniref:Cloroperoxidase n=2 Tax=Rhizopus microsporus TaxID=58291 RepID=A0A2G4TAE2_RHIZD|nr:Cloroperoxidase [Rhizopus microsporus ATCC 52813]ORE10666.1 Cloroperoxidase [Rhizopus microsporus var. microsporus]PHZ17979.1 Cloroperoxidase [Rhizopus microsporus ATCC 52813]
MDNKSEANQPKIRIKKPGIISILLGAILAMSIMIIMVIEVDGRSKMIKSPEQWYELMKKHPYERKETDLRSPCPMLNTLANHGFLPRDGRKMTPKELYEAMMLVGLHPSSSVAFLLFLYITYNPPNPNRPFLSQFTPAPSIDFHRLTLSNLLEHDVSLSRHDLSLPPFNTTVPVPEYVERMVRLAKFNNTGTEHEDIFTRKNQYDARRLRWLETVRDNDAYFYGLFPQLASGVECSLLMDVIGRNGQLRVDHLESILLHERFPDDWYPRTSPYTIRELVFKPLECWWGLYHSQVSLSLLDELK